MDRSSTRRDGFVAMSALAFSVAVCIWLGGCTAAPQPVPHRPVGSAQAAASPAPQPPATEAQALQAQVDAHLSRLAGADAAQSPRRDLPPRSAGGPPDIIWSDEASRSEAARQRAQNAATVAPRTPLIDQQRHAQQPPAANQNAAAPDTADRPAGRVTANFDSQTEDAGDDTAEAASVQPTLTAAGDGMNRDQLLAMLADRIQQSNDPVMTKALFMAAMSLANPDQSLDEEALAELDHQQREQVRLFHTMIVSLGRQIAGGDQRVDARQISDKLDNLFGRPVEISTAVVCKRVAGFADYEEFPTDADEKRKTYLVPTGGNRRLGLYVELQHFRVTRNESEKKPYRVSLSQQVSLFTVDGVQVFKEQPAEVLDQTRSRRRDFFTTQVVTLPANIPPGRYVLNVRVTDRGSDTMDEKKIPIHITTPQGVANQRRIRP